MIDHFDLFLFVPLLEYADFVRPGLFVPIADLLD